MEPTEEMIQAFGRAWHAEDEQGTHVPGARRRAGIRAVLEIVERDAVKPGPCMQSAPGLFEGVPPVTCSLLAGHAGGHTNGVTSWTRADDTVEPMTPGGPAPSRSVTCHALCQAMGEQMPGLHQ